MIIYLIYSMRYIESMPFLRIDNMNHRTKTKSIVQNKFKIKKQTKIIKRSCNRIRSSI
jgi:hypothetical protein